MSLNCNQCGHNSFYIYYEKKIVCRNCLNILTWKEGVEETFGSINLRAVTDSMGGIQVFTKDTTPIQVAHIKFIPDKKRNTICVTSYRYEYIAKICEALDLYRSVFTGLMVVLETPHKDAKICPLCQQVLSHKMYCWQGKHQYLVSSKKMLISILLGLSNGLRVEEVHRALSDSKEKIKIDGTTYYFDFRTHGELAALVISKSILKVLPDLENSLSIFQKTPGGDPQKVLFINI